MLMQRLVAAYPGVNKAPLKMPLMDVGVGYSFEVIAELIQLIVVAQYDKTITGFEDDVGRRIDFVLAGGGFVTDDISPGFFADIEVFDWHSPACLRHLWKVNFFKANIWVGFVGDVGKELHGARFTDQGRHIKATDLLRHDDVISTCQAQFFHRVAIEGSADDFYFMINSPKWWE